MAHSPTQKSLAHTHREKKKQSFKTSDALLQPIERRNNRVPMVNIFLVQTASPEICL